VARLQLEALPTAAASKDCPRTPTSVTPYMLAKLVGISSRSRCLNVQLTSPLLHTFHMYSSYSGAADQQRLDFLSHNSLNSINHT
jgi:hypothetical protein